MYGKFEMIHRGLWPNTGALLMPIDLNYWNVKQHT